MMVEPLQIFKGQDFYVPHFQVVIGDRPLEREVILDIAQVSYKDSMQEVDSFEITINNWDARLRSFKYSDDDKFLPGKKVELWMGYYGRDRVRLMLTGEITSLRPTFPAGGQPTLAISGQNVLHRLRTRQCSVSYQRRTDSQIAEEIAGRLGVEIEVPDKAQEQPHNYLLQANQYDVIFLMERARKIGYDLFVKEFGQGGHSQPSKLYFGRSQLLPREVYQLKYGLNLIEFQPTLTTANQVGSVRVQAWDSTRGRLIEGQASRSQLSTNGVGDRGGQRQIEQAFNEREEVIHDQPVASQEEANRLARETLERIAKEMVKGTGSTIGLPDLRAGSILNLDGLGTRFSGRYFVTSTTHSIGDSGYTSRFECRREEVANR